MITIHLVSLDEIEGHLSRLGGGNHVDNMKRLRRFAIYLSATLTEVEFLSLVFLQSEEVLSIVPPGQNRTLGAAARRAIDLRESKLSGNWDLAENLNRMRTKLAHKGGRLEPLVLCEAREGEQMHGQWYIQDGSHRALAYGTLLALGEVRYEHQETYCMSEQRYQSLLR